MTEVCRRAVLPFHGITAVVIGGNDAQPQYLQCSQICGASWSSVGYRFYKKLENVSCEYNLLNG